MPDDPRVEREGIGSVQYMHVGATDPCALDPDQNFTGTGHDLFHRFDLKRVWCLYFNRNHDLDLSRSECWD